MTYQNGKIYCIRNHIDDEVYIGSTTQLLCKRMVKHRHDMKLKQHVKVYTKMNELGIDKFYIELIENYPCESKEELCKREGHFIREMGTLNSVIAGRTQKEWKIEHKEHIKEYQENNKYSIQAYHKSYTEEHKEKRKEYNEVNRVEILEKKRLYRIKNT